MGALRSSCGCEHLQEEDRPRGLRRCHDARRVPCRCHPRHAGVTAPFSGLYCDTTDNGATGAEQAPLLVRWWSCSARPTTSTSRSTTSSTRGVTRTPPWSTCRTTPVSAGPPLLPGYTVLVAEPGSLVATWGDGTVAGDGHDRVVDHARAASARSSMRSNQSLTSACWTSPSPGPPAPRKCLDPAPERARPTTPAGRRTCARAHRRAGVQSTPAGLSAGRASAAATSPL